MVLRCELTPRFERMVKWFDAAGALTKEVQISRPDLAVAVDIPGRTIDAYAQHAEQMGLLIVRRTTRDGAFGSPRVPNYYKLSMSYKQWRARRKALSDEYRARDKQVKQEDRVTLLELEGEDERRRAAAMPPPQPSKPAKVGVLAAQYLNDDDLLAGW